MDQQRELGYQATSGHGASAVLSTHSIAELIFQTSRGPAIVLDLDLRVKIANRAFYDVFRLTRSDVEKRPVDELAFASWNAAGFRDQLAKVVWENTHIDDLPVECDISEIGPRIFLLCARRIDSEDGAPEAVFLEMEDITRRENARAEAKSHTDDLERSNTDLEQFAYIASHDMQEPLRMVGSYTQLLGERYRGKLDADADEFIGFAVDGVHRMQTLIDGLLEYSRINRGGRKFQDTNCGDVLAAVQNSLQQAILDSGAVITSDPLPIIAADSGQIGQLFQNMVSNAIKFRKPGASPQIHLSASQKSGHWLFSIHDDGIGIPEDQRGRLFQLFQRLHSRSEYPGTGIGLAVCKKIVERHGGAIWLESEPEKGSTFFFSIPMNDGQTEELVGPIEILVVEDNEGDVRLTREALADAKVRNRLFVVENGLEAVRYLRREGPYSEAARPDLILLDLKMPKKGGHDVLREIKKDESLRRIPVLVMTVSPAEEDIVRSYDLHANCCITKPVDSQQLSKLIHAFFSTATTKASESQCQS